MVNGISVAIAIVIVIESAFDSNIASDSYNERGSVSVMCIYWYWC